MDALLVITLVCFFALFVGALAIARRIRIITPDPQDLRRNSHWPTPGTPDVEVQSLLPRHPPEQAVHHLIQQKEPDWRFLISEERRNRWSKQGVSTLSRKPPRSVHLNGKQRRDWVYFNRDLGDPNDPYEPLPPQAANSGLYFEFPRQKRIERIK